jgi:hypothetical protein
MHTYSLKCAGVEVRTSRDLRLGVLRVADLERLFAVTIFGQKPQLALAHGEAVGTIIAVLQF